VVLIIRIKSAVHENFQVSFNEIPLNFRLNKTRKNSWNPSDNSYEYFPALIQTPSRRYAPSVKYFPGTCSGTLSCYQKSE